MKNTFKLSSEHKNWIKNRVQSEFRRNIDNPVKSRIDLRKLLEELLIAQSGKCAWSGAKMSFDACHSGSNQKNNPGTHPLYASLEHKIPRNAQDGNGYEIVCAKLNDLKGMMPYRCFKALQKTKSWQELMEKWKILSMRKGTKSADFIELLKDFDSKPIL